MYGKSVGATARLAKHYRVPVIALAGSLATDYRTLYNLGIDAINALPSGPMSLDYAMEHAALLMTEATERTLRLVKIGQNMQYRLQ
jgi:glycerate kinase